MKRNVTSLPGTEILISEARNWPVRLAGWVSLWLNPFFIAIPLSVVVAFGKAGSWREGMLWTAIFIGGAALLPILHIIWGVHTGRYSDYHISRREQRLVPFLVTLGCIAAVYAVLWLLQAPIELLAMIAGSIMSIVAALLITLLARWKISLHLVGIAGAIMTLGLLVSPQLFWFAPLILVVGWARWLVRAHTVMQAIAGAAVSSVVTWSVFRMFGVI